MATSLQIQTFETIPPAAPEIVAAVDQPKADSHWLDRTASPREEARILFDMMIRKQETVESIRELIAVPLEIEEALTLYARRHPEDAFGIERVLKFRKRVAEEFDGLIAFRETVERTQNASVGQSD